MKKIVSIWTFFFTYSILGFAQNTVTYANDYATMPVAVVKVNFHFLPVNPTYAGSNVDFTQSEAKKLAEDIIYYANQNFSAMLPTNFEPTFHVPNAKLKLQLYDGGQGSVFTYPGPLNTTNYSPKYGKNVVDIVVRYGTPNYTCGNITGHGENEIILCNFSKSIINDASMQDSRARVLCHEIGHIFNLKHTFDCTNQCSTQIVHTIECGGTCGCANPSNPSNNLMSYGGSRSLTPCQWEVMFNAITINNYAFVTWDCQKSNTPFTVAAGNVIWNDLKLMNCDVIVPNGTQLYIYNDVKFVNDCKIYVESGASLTVNNKTITSLCPRGIESQGAVTLTNATIEHAVTGVSRKGGSLQTSLTLFKNNMRDMEYLDKSLTPIDKHVNSDFLVDNNYRGSMIRSRVTMWNSKQIKFEGCKFENQHSNPYDVSWNLDYDWQGIYAVGSEFEVNKSVTSIFNRKSTFTNFAIGIRTASFGTANMTSVTNSVFDKNNIGVVSDEVGEIFIEKNIFNVRWNNSFPQTDWFRAGLLINSGSGYMVKNNQFVGIGNSSGQYTFGTLVMSTGESENRIESNKYSGLYVGNRVLQRNTNNSYQAPTGLQLICGDHTASVYDNTIEQAYVYNAGIRYKQGGSDEDDGNFFSKNSDAVDIWTDTQDGFERFYLNTSQFNQRRIAVVNNADLIQQTPTEGGPSCSSFVMFMSPNPNLGVNAAAMSNLSAAKLNPDNVLELTNAFEEADLALKTAKKQHTDLIDGGNQAGLLSNINSRWNRDTAALRTNLLAQSPNLSTTVLLAVAQLGTLKKQTLMRIFLANPNACREPQFVRKLTRDLPSLLTETDIQQLKNAPRGRSKREELEETVNKNSSKRAEIGKQLVFDLMADSLDQTEKLRYWWGRLESRHAQYKIAETYIKESQSNRYEALLRGLNNDLADSEDLLKENQDYVELYGIKSQILKSGRSLRQLNATEITNIRRIANNTYGNAAVQAKTILCAAIGECKKTEVPRFPLSFETRQIAIGKGGHPNLSPTSDNFRVYPNPTSGNVTIDFNSKAEFTEGSISLLDMTGKIILNQKINDAQKQVVWQTEQLRPGLYFILFKVGNQTVYQTKLSIQK